MSRGFKWIRNGALILVILAFVLLYGPGQSGVVAGAVAEVDGEVISREAFEIWRERYARQFSELEGLEPDQLRDLIDRSTLSTLVQRQIIAAEARELGLALPNEALRNTLAADPQYQQGGVYEPELVEIAATRLGYSVRRYLDEVRGDLLVQGFERLVTSTVRVSDARVRAAIAEAQTELQLRYVRAEPAGFRAASEPPPEDVAAFLESDTERVGAEYNRRRDEFERPEQVVARHILFTGADAREQAKRARARLDAGEGFADLALELSQDAATRDQAGLLGAFPRGRMLPAFEEVAFALEPGQISDPVETERGLHLILVEAHEDAQTQTLDEVAPRLAFELLRDERARQAAKAAAESLLAELAGKSFDWYEDVEHGFAAAVRQVGLEPQTTSRFSADDAAVPELAQAEGVLEAALALSEEHPYVPEVFDDGHAYYVVALFRRTEPDPATLEGELDAVRTQLVRLARSNTTRVWVESRQRELEETGALRVFPLYPQS